MVCLGLEPGAAGWKAQTNPLSYGGTSFFLSTRKQASNETRKDTKPKIVERGGGDGVRGREIGAGGELWARGRYSKTFNNYSGRR